MNRDLTFEQFAPHVGRSFTLSAADGPDAGRPFAATLTDCRASDGAGGATAFTLDFVADPGAPAAQAIYRISGPDADGDPVFLVPSGRSDDKLLFHAVFNRTSRNGGTP